MSFRKTAIFLFIAFCLVAIPGAAAADADAPAHPASSENLPAPSSFPTAEAADLSGHWKGAIDLPGTKLEIELYFSGEDDGTWKGAISIPLQNARDLPLSGIAVDGAEVVFAIAGVPGEPTFKGTFENGGSKIAGTFTQSGGSFAFEIARSDDPAAEMLQALEGFEAVIEDGLEKFKVPGVAFAVVRNKEVILAEGFGLRDMENKLPMTADTLLAIGSSSKAFTAFTLATLVDQGALEWDKPVRNAIPWFRLHDAQAGERLTPRDLVTHRSGLPRHDAVWYNNKTSTREDFVRALAHLPATADLRETWQYNNLMFLTAGYLTEVLTGQSWEDAVRDLVFDPLEMVRSNFSVAESRKDENHALPYAERNGELRLIPFRDITLVGPAGSINSSVAEMSRWIIAHLNGGRYGEKEVIGAATLTDLHTPHMTMGAPTTDPRIGPASYALGWMVDTYRGHRRIHHGGNIDGFSAMVSFLPDEGLGFVALANKSASGLPELLIRTAADRILDLEPVDWIGEAAKRRAEGEEIGKAASERQETRRRSGTSPAHKLAEYAGDYSHPGYGDIKVTLKGKALEFVYNGIATPLEHWHFETWNGGKADDPVFTNMKLTFRTDLNGQIVSVEAPFEPSVDPIVFAKKPDVRFFDPEYLETLTGSYQLASQTVTVGLKASTLTLHIPGQPVYDLVPEVGGEFSLKVARIVRVRFLEDAEGRVTGLEVAQPGGVFEYKKKKD